MLLHSGIALLEVSRDAIVIRPFDLPPTCAQGSDEALPPVGITFADIPPDSDDSDAAAGATPAEEHVAKSCQDSAEAENHTTGVKAPSECGSDQAESDEAESSESGDGDEAGPDSEMVEQDTLQMQVDGP